MRQVFALLLIALCVMAAPSAVASASPNALPCRPLVRKVVPLSLRYRQQISQQIHLPNQQQSDAGSATSAKTVHSSSSVGEAAVLPGDAGRFQTLIPLRT
jgi:hypothetical protein